MLDVINLPENTTKECSLNDLPLPIIEKIKSFLNKDEPPHLCIVSKHHLIREVEIYVVSSFCVIHLVNEIKNGKLLTETPENHDDRCVFLSKIIGIERRYWKNNSGGGVNLFCSSRALDTSFGFHDFELLRKFESLVFSLMQQNHHA